MDDRHVPLTGDTRPRRPRPHAVHLGGYLGRTAPTACGCSSRSPSRPPAGPCWSPRAPERRAPAVPVVVCRGLGDGRGTTAPTAAHELGLEVRWRDGTPRRVLLAVHVALGGDDGQDQGPLSVTVAPDSVRVAAAGATGPELEIAVVAGGLESVDSDVPLFADSRSRALPWLALTAQASPHAVWPTASPAGALGGGPPRPGPAPRRGLGGNGAARHTARGTRRPRIWPVRSRAFDTALPWLAHNALVHYLSPRGLEQCPAAPGARATCARGRWGCSPPSAGATSSGTSCCGSWRPRTPAGTGPRRSSSCRLRTPPVSTTRTGTWCSGRCWRSATTSRPLATRHCWTSRCPWWATTGRRAGGRGRAPAPGPAARRRAARGGDPAVGIRPRRLERLAPVGRPAAGRADGVDLDDGAARAVPAFARGRAPCLRRGADARRGGRGRGGAAQSALTEVLLVDGVLSGYAVYGEGDDIEPLVHPRDRRTGLTHGVLPWIHAITADLLSPQDARRHLDLIAEHLLGPDGARLFDRPVRYSGGPMSVFQRAESSTFWGREIGLMYMHAHLRYAEALARFGDAPGLFAALAKVVPVGITDRVEQARPRQSTTYYSSSDGVFADRSDASARYADLMRGEVALEGGWRVYSSGPGLFLRLVTETLLGVRLRADRVEVDPVLDPRLDGLTASMPLGDKRIEVTFRVGDAGVGVASVEAAWTSCRADPATEPLPRGRRVGGPRGPRRAGHRRRRGRRGHGGDAMTGSPQAAPGTAPGPFRTSLPASLAGPGSAGGRAGRAAHGRDDPGGEGRPDAPGREHTPTTTPTRCAARGSARASSPAVRPGATSATRASSRSTSTPPSGTPSRAAAWACRCSSAAT